MFPFRDHNYSRNKPYVTWLLIAINIIVFLSYSPLFGDDVALGNFFDQWAMIPAEVANGHEYYTALTSMFLHGGIMHIAGNMLFLWIYGDNVEDAMGHWQFLLFYLACGFIADAAHVASNPYSDVPTVGASGAIAGVMGAYLLLYPKAKVDVLLILVVILKKITLPSYIILGLWMIMQLFSGVATTTEGGGVAYWAHIGGFIAGMVLAFPLWNKLGATRFWHEYQFHPPHPDTDWGGFKTVKLSDFDRLKRK